MQNEILFESVGVREVDERRRIEQVRSVETQRGGEDIVAFERMGNCIGRTLGEKRSDGNGSKVEEDEKRV